MLLTNEPGLMAGASTLLNEALKDNKAALSTVYQTGIFYFALAYCGSNLVEISRLFHVSPKLYLSGFLWLDYIHHQGVQQDPLIQNFDGEICTAEPATYPFGATHANL